MLIMTRIHKYLDQVRMRTASHDMSPLDFPEITAVTRTTVCDWYEVNWRS